MPNSQTQSLLGKIEIPPEKSSNKKGGIKICISQDIIKKIDSVYKRKSNLKIINSVIDMDGNEVLIQDEKNLFVDKSSRTYLNDNSQETLFTFPLNTQNRDYNNVAIDVYPGITVKDFKFYTTESIFGMSVLVFKYSLENIDTPTDMLFLNKDPNIVSNVKADYFGKFLIEPTTGMVIRQESNWSYYTVNDATGEATILEKGMLSHQDEETKRLIRLAQSRKAMLQIYETLIPVYLITFAFAFIVGAFLKNSNN